MSIQQPSVREKLLTTGAASLSDAELLTAFISSGSAQKSCTQLALDLLRHLGDLRSILNADLQTFQQVKGLSTVRFVQLQAVQEMCRRSDFISLQKEVQLHNAHQTSAFLKRKLRDKKNETFAALFLDSQHRILTYEELFTGTIDTTSIYVRPIIDRTLQLNAAALIIAHNHPSGTSEASQEDRALTTHLRQTLALIDVQLLDHLVIGDNEVYSITSELKWNCH